MEGMLIACGQITWPRSSMTQEQILAEIAQAGYDGAPASAQNVEETRKLFESAGLKPAPGYLGAEFWDSAQTDQIVQRATEHAAGASQLGLTELYVAANLTPERRAVSGHVSASDALSDDGFRTLADTLNRVGEATLQHGVRACFHNHVGSFIETRAEIDHLFSLVDRSLVYQGPDIGHLAWAGDDVVAFCRDYASDIKTIHVKDINPEVLAEGVANSWDYSGFTKHGIFTELGEGLVDFPAVFTILKDAGFQGWVVVETDVTQKPTALESATISRDYLRSIGV